ncbi:MAG: WYL domain-containing protein [Lachnospiraceae bacterium]|nr:WYL domain-containing protein [Lachnospiraceae bacterium]
MIKHYRVDKMLRITALKEARLGKETFNAFDMAKYAKSVFGMFTGEETAVTLVAENQMAGVVIDRFGKDIPIKPLDETHFQAEVKATISPQFIGWIMHSVRA